MGTGYRISLMLYHKPSKRSLRNSFPVPIFPVFLNLIMLGILTMKSVHNNVGLICVYEAYQMDSGM
jgi:hypothetical protein